MSSISWDYVRGVRTIDPDRYRDRGKRISELRGPESDREGSRD